MKLIYLTCNISVQEKVISKLDELKLKDYQIIDEVKALPVIGNPKLNNAVWPGFNTTIVMQFRKEERAQEVMKALRELNKDVQTNEELITACMLPMDDYFWD